jgi:peptide/nickel transport system permease protein
LSVLMALGVGSGIGFLAGYAGGWIDEILMRGIDILLAFPSILLAILVVAILGPSLLNATVAIAIISVPTYARLARSAALEVVRQPYMEAAKATGAGHVRMVAKHLIPNCLLPLSVQASLSIATAILEIAGLSFLGLGAQPPQPEWGSMLNGARAYIRSAPWTVAFPGLAISVFVLGFNAFGDGLREVVKGR